MNADRRAKNKRSAGADVSCQHALVRRMEACRLRVVMHPRMTYWFRETMEAEDKGQNGINVSITERIRRHVGADCVSPQGSSSAPGFSAMTQMVEMKPELPDPRDMRELERIKAEPGDPRYVLQDNIKDEQLVHVKQERGECSREKAPSLSKQQRASIKKPRDCIRLGHAATHELIIAKHCLCCVDWFPRPRLLESFTSVRKEPQWTQQDTAVIQIREKLGKKRCLYKVKHTSWIIAALVANKLVLCLQ